MGFRQDLAVRRRFRTRRYAPEFAFRPSERQWQTSPAHVAEWSSIETRRLRYADRVTVHKKARVPARSRSFK